MIPWHEISSDRPVVIAGPTASGKSALALEIAERRGGVIVNADALQVWSCWRVLSARPDAGEEARAPHRLYGHRDPGQDYSVGHWLREVAGLLHAGARPIIVGGTGLYLTALTEGLAEIPPVPAAIRAEADGRLAGGGLAAMIADLDPETAARTDLRNPARVQRAWEVARATGRGLAAWQADTGAPLLPIESAHTFLLWPDRDWLADRIDTRFDRMLEDGALEEVRAVLPIWDPTALWAKAIGAPELIAHLRRDLPLDEARRQAQAASRQYAKRQRTWFRRRMRDWAAIDLP
ncbi:tRNA dimethylallyltransferase [Defluviimonas denitrificans]|uniref:tRNA dimethylallyltransferase n=1 Tax=Albidovulum denitrificans TaxID=404881 RepID=A0A2S8SCP6_9RHOB|nr:tRNA (adenosine(37)-N6)-dimethylallyltransferase MiaA [Defluviimonas denitrificans]PQV58543.1 tRNA dimethylallyltransferase [Defluviimonas denitrificans]